MICSLSFIYTLLAWICMGRPHASSMSHSVHIFILMISFFLNLNLTLGPPQKRLSINWTWPLWSNSCGGLSLPTSSSLLPPTVRRIEGICSWVTVTTEGVRVQWQMKSQRLVGFFLYWSSQLLYNVQFFKTILCGGIAPFLADSTVVLLTCGWVVKFEDSFMSLQTALLW